jgi:hypothetical protein
MKHHNNAQEAQVYLQRRAGNSEWEDMFGALVSWEDDHFQFSPMPRYGENYAEYEYRVREIEVYNGYVNSEREMAMNKVGW